jgi:membrane associated rhomboid family serine protease
MTFIILLLAVGWLVRRSTTAAERQRFVELMLRKRRQFVGAATRRHPEVVAFWEMRCERTPSAPVIPALVALNILVFVLMLFGSGALGAPETLIAWGGSSGPRTANGEWWRLVTTMFVHVSVLHLFVDLAGLLAVGVVLERLVGPLALAAVYVAAGVSSSAFALIASPTGVSVGASGAIFGLYGLMLAAAMGSVFHRSTPKVPLAFAMCLAPAAVVFTVYSLVTSAIASGPELAALLVGWISGLFMARDIEERPVPAIRTAPVMVAALAMVIVTVRPLSGMTDVTPEIHRLVIAEQEMAARYRTAIDQFTSGRINAQELATVIDHDITPVLQASQVRVASLERVPDEQKPLLVAAEQYLQLRDESWRIRSKALKMGSLSMLRQADMSEVTSRNAFRKIE